MLSLFGSWPICFDSTDRFDCVHEIHGFVSFDNFTAFFQWVLCFILWMTLTVLMVFDGPRLKFSVV